MYNTIYPNYVRSYYNIHNSQIKRKEDDEKNSQSSKQAENNAQQPSAGRQNIEGNSFSSQLSSAPSYFPTGEKVAIDYTKRQINIEQVLTDFTNTANAIGAPDDIKAEVASYLDLIKNQSLKSNPNKQIIQSNLKNASQILDEYITNTLQKPSKVVENWVDALFMQQIEYKAQNIQPEIPILKEEIQEDIVPIEQDSEKKQLTEQKTEVYVPNDPQLKKMFIQAKKYAAINNSEKALKEFQNTYDYAQSIGDDEACAIVNFEKALLYDDADKIEEALYNYNIAAKQSTNKDIKAKAHIKMGKIYDDFVKFEPALEHYCAAVSYSGESDNLKLQTQALSDLAQMHAERYDKQNAIAFMLLSDIPAKESGDKKVIGLISSKNGKTCEKLSENAQALKYYTTSAKSFYDISDSANLARKYQSAAEIMLKYGNSAKAKRLLSKAYVAAMQTDDSALKSEITKQITSLNAA